MSENGATIQVALDPTNPGQFYACCGLLELADRLWRGKVSGAFVDGGRRFLVQVPEPSDADPGLRLQNEMASCTVSNTMSGTQLARLDQLSARKKSELDAELEEEKKALESLRREAPVVLSAPFGLVIDWHLDDRAGGSSFKTWAGQQSILDIARGMHTLASGIEGSLETCLFQNMRGGQLPFNFDSDLGGQGAALDVGFSLDPLPDLEIRVRPAIEFFAFVGLQRFRPQRQGRDNRYRYCTWSQLLPPSVAVAAACGIVRLDSDPLFEFRLLYRTKYLKSFLPAHKVRGEL